MTPIKIIEVHPLTFNTILEHLIEGNNIADIAES